MINTTRIGASLLLAALTLANAERTHAQDSGLRVGAGALAEGFVFAKSETVGMQGVLLVTVPFGVRYSGPIVLEVAGNYAHATIVRRAGSRPTISGLTDTSIRLALPLANQRVTISGTAYLPTGKSSQTAAEAEVAGVIAADLLPFRITNWGSGGGFDVSATVAVPVAGFGLGVRAGYAAAREFEPLADGPTVFSYQPGDQKYLRLAIDHGIGATGKGSVSATIQRFNDDAFDGQNLYRSGDRLELLAALDLGLGAASSAALYGGLMHRSRGVFLDASQELQAQDLIVAGAGLRLAVGNSALLPSADVRVFRREDGLGQGYVMSFGTAIEMGSVVPTIRGRYGNLILNDQASTVLYGAEVGLAFRFGR